jgi:hypothetical protein
MASRTRRSASSLRRWLYSMRVHHRVALVAARRHLVFGALLQAIEVREREAAFGADVDLSRLDRGSRGGLIGNETPDDLVEIGKAGAPVVLVAHRDDVLTTFVLRELERPGADRRGVRRVLEQVRALVDMFRNHVAQVGQRPQQQVERHRPRVAEHRGGRVRRVDGVEVELQGRAVVEVLLPHLHRGELHVGRGEGLAVVPLDAFAQREGDGLAVGRRLPGGRQHRRRFALRVEVDQRLHDLAGDHINAGRGAQRGVQDALLALHVDRDGAAAARRRRLRLQHTRNRNGQGQRGAGDQCISTGKGHFCFQFSVCEKLLAAVSLIRVRTPP